MLTEFRPSCLPRRFLLDTPRLFEDFTTVVLSETIVSAYGGRVQSQVRSHLDEARRVALRPDIVWKKHGTPAAVIDAKYKAEKPTGYSNGDLYQLLAYCTILGLAQGHLVYAKGNGEPARHVVRQSGIEILCHAVDLSLPPDSLINQIRDLSRVIASAHRVGHARAT